MSALIVCGRYTRWRELMSYDQELRSSALNRDNDKCESNLIMIKPIIIEPPLDINISDFVRRL